MLNDRQLAASHLAQSILYLRRARRDSDDAVADKLQPFVKEIETLDTKEATNG